MGQQLKQLSKNRFGIIQLSDLQFGEKHRFNDNPDDLVLQLPADVRKIAQKYDFRPLYVILSGDISETGDEGEFNDGTQKLNRLIDELDIVGVKVLCVPGNHDVNWKSSRKGEVRNTQLTGSSMGRPNWPARERTCCEISTASRRSRKCRLPSICIETERLS
jgi:hypothetical protein